MESTCSFPIAPIVQEQTPSPTVNIAPMEVDIPTIIPIEVNNEATVERQPVLAQTRRRRRSFSSNESEDNDYQPPPPANNRRTSNKNQQSLHNRVNI